MLPTDNNYMLYRLHWNPERNKFDKKPCRLDGTSLAANEPIPTAARDQITVPTGCALGYWLKADSNLFFIDLDECVQPDGTLTPDAARIAAPFVNAGCFFEASSSGRGAHIIGRYTGNLPAHSNRRPTVHKYEFYTRDRGIALNLDRATGSANVDATAALLAMLPEVFPPRAVTVSLPVGQRRPEWRGPEDDDELIRRALAARGSAAVAFGSKASFADLWEGRVEKNSESDMALASHLAFWTGCDVDRIERLMLRSGLAREKWKEHRTYLRDITITRACATTTNVYQEPERANVLTKVVGAPTSDIDYYALADKAISDINNSGTLRVLMNDIVPGISQLGLPTVHAQRVATALNKRLELFDAKLPISAVRQLITPPVVGTLVDSTPPEWFAGMCYVKRTDKFFNVNTGSEYTAEGFRTEFARYMPLTSSGKREDPVQWARERWNIVTVDDLMYRPGYEPFFEYAGRQYANTFNPNTLPPVTEPSPHCAMCIQAFQNHLYLLCGQRDWLYTLLLQWLAHNVQHPGHKIRWSPLIKGVQGDGKSIVGDLIFAVMGEANVKITSPSNISNKGGFTDWATGKAINFIEEIRLEGREKHALYNAMKLFVGDTRADVNRKGRAAGDTMPNVMNHWANTNYGDAIPVDPKERRWLIVFSPYNTIEEAAAAKGLPDADSLVRHFKMLGASMRAEPGAWRGWLMSLDTSSFDPDGRAPDTPERESMRLMSGNTMDQAIVDILEQGGHGITKDCFSSSCLLGMVKIKTGENPDNRGWNSTLARLGYIQMTKTVWWNGSSHRIWAKRTMTNDEIREKLEKG